MAGQDARSFAGLAGSLHRTAPHRTALLCEFPANGISCMTLINACLNVLQNGRLSDRKRRSDIAIVAHTTRWMLDVMGYSQDEKS